MAHQHCSIGGSKSGRKAQGIEVALFDLSQAPGCCLKWMGCEHRFFSFNEESLKLWLPVQVKHPSIPPDSGQSPDREPFRDTNKDNLAISAVAAPVECERLANDRVGQFMKLLPELLNGERAEAVHDLRVCSRRIQQILLTLFQGESAGGPSQVIRAVRQARRGLSGWRDCDVVMALLDRRLRRLRNSDERQAWQAVRDYLARRREKEIRRARRRLAKRKLFTLAQRARDLVSDRESNSASNDSADTRPIEIVEGFIKTAYSEWQAALTAAADTENPANAHRFRIKTKQLRYRMELARDLGDDEVSRPLSWLKSVQEHLGQWHDRVQLARIAMDAFTEADLLLTAPRSASLLLKRLARELLSEANKVKLLLSAVKNGQELLQLEAWVSGHSQETTPSPMI